MVGKGAGERDLWRVTLPSVDLPQVTAIVPCYNAEKFIGKTLDCLAAQTWPRLEILIGDDASNDKTIDIVREFIVRQKNARLIARDVNLGWLRNTNDLMAKATGELLFFAFHDDLIAPEYVEKLSRVLVHRPEAILAFSDVELVNLHGSTRVMTFDSLDGITGSCARGLKMVQRPFNWWVPNRGLFRAEAFQRIGGIKPNAQGEYSADWTWLLHMALLGEFVRLPEVLCRKYYKPNSLSKTWSHDRKQKRALRLAGIREIRYSKLDLGSKAILIAYLRVPWDLKALVSPWVPSFLKRYLKKFL